MHPRKGGYEHYPTHTASCGDLLLVCGHLSLKSLSHGRDLLLIQDQSGGEWWC